MSYFKDTPSVFQVLSTQPELKIRYLIKTSHKIFLFLFFSPFLVIFAGHCWILLLVLHELFNLRLWQAVQVFSCNYGNFWYAPLLFVFTFFILGMPWGVVLHTILGSTELHATSESITIIYRLLGMSFKNSVLASDIRYFNQFLKRDDCDSWELEVVTSQRLYDKEQSFPAWFPASWVSEDMVTRMNYKTVLLCRYVSPNPSYWLGKILADFYKIEFRASAFNSDIEEII